MESKVLILLYTVLLLFYIVSPRSSMASASQEAGHRVKAPNVDANRNQFWQDNFNFKPYLFYDAER